MQITLNESLYLKESIVNQHNKNLIRWVKNHHWDSLEKDKDLILRHLRTFTGDEAIYGGDK